MADRKQFIKLEKGQSKVIKVVNIKKQDVVNIEGEEENVTLWSELSKEQLRTLWQADRANPNGPLVGKRLRITKPVMGAVTVELVSGAFTENPAADEDIPF